MKPRSYLAAFVAALVLFIWQGITHMAIPSFHAMLYQFADQNETERVIAENSVKDGQPADGIYVLPNMDMKEKDKAKKKAAQEAVQKQYAEGVSVFAVVNLNGKKTMTECLIYQFIFNFIAALLIAFMLSKLSHDGMGCRMGVTVFFALFAFVTAILPNWAWWGYPGMFIGYLAFDLIVGWILAGYVLAKMLPKIESPEEGNGDELPAEEPA